MLVIFVHSCKWYSTAKVVDVSHTISIFLVELSSWVYLDENVLKWIPELNQPSQLTFPFFGMLRGCCARSTWRQGPVALTDLEDDSFEEVSILQISQVVRNVTPPNQRSGQFEIPCSKDVRMKLRKVKVDDFSCRWFCVFFFREVSRW